MTAGALDLRALRRLRGWTQLRVARAARVSRVTVRVYELAPEEVRPRLRARLAKIYSRLACHAVIDLGGRSATIRAMSVVVQ